MESLGRGVSHSRTKMDELANKWENINSDSVIDYYQGAFLQGINSSRAYSATCHCL